jgi:Spy/CpxP family protein refolding chaperone
MKSFPRKALGLLGCAAIFTSAALAAEDGRSPPPPAPMMGGHGPAPMFMQGVPLDEAQQDKVFAIMHAQEPVLREQAKAQRKARESLRAMAVSGQFDEARAAALAQAEARAIAAIELQRARSDAQLFALLTPEQRRQATEAGPRRDPRRDPRHDQP